MARVWLGVLLYAAVCPIAYSAASDFGTTGLIKMPNARMEKDGALSYRVVRQGRQYLQCLVSGATKGPSDWQVYHF